MIKRLLLLLCFLFLLSGRVGFCAETTYTITETELTTLETIFQELKISNEIQLSALNQSKTDLLTAQGDLMKYRAELEKQKKTLLKLQEELRKSRNELQTTQSELQKVNESLKTYAQEVKKAENRLKRQRNVWTIVAALATGYAIMK